MTAPDARNAALASQARRVYTEALVRGLAHMAAVLNEAAAQLLLMPAEYAVAVARRDGVEVWNRHGGQWFAAFAQALRQAAAHGVGDSRAAAMPLGRTADLSLVDDITIEREISGSRLSLAMLDSATWEFTDLRTRMQMLERQDDLPQQDLLRSHVVARLALEAWYGVGLGQSEWQMLQGPLQDEFAQLLGAAYHETNRWLIAQQVMPEIDLRPFIRRAPVNPGTTQRAGLSMAAPLTASPTPSSQAQPMDIDLPLGGPPAAPGAMDIDLPLDLPSAPGALAQGQQAGGSAASGMVASVQSAVRSQADQVLAQLQRVLGRQVPSMAPQLKRTPAQLSGKTSELAARKEAEHEAQAAGPVTMSARLHAAISHAQEALAKKAQAVHSTGSPAPQQLEEVKARNQAFKQVLKQAADTPAERATIEVVALLFQAILTEERIPATIRVWFARLQMPVLRVAVSEPDFFATNDHPARRLIDRMGACVMGFNSASGGDVSEALEREIKRVVQVVEAYPDTGRRVFQTVLTEFEKFLSHYFEQENSASRKGVSLAQQIEQRETLAIQYTIELRKMLSEVPVQDGVRQFLFQIWADVLAVTAVRSGAQSDQTKQMKRAAADLIWSASAKVSREERAEVIRRLPPLLKMLREGMGHAGLSSTKQDEHIRALNNSLAAAFTAKAAVIPRERLDDLMGQLETLEAMLPDSESGELNEALVRDLSSHESDGMEVVAEGGSAPTPAMLAWAKELQVGSWYMLDYRGRVEPVQLAWRGLRHHLVLFVSSKGRGVLFQQSRLAAFLQAGLLLPAQDEALTVKATRNALAKLDVDPSRLLN
ncbi:DUF1631 family protein [Paucibacter sp. APW11]|uniref:DUF1631 family protein n=1 Tax=Roseateles aquae TaxID=3077235 RepID=A0ABU3PC23_9BURK|nr:DUF1631 family protein [Paucibacter sp. APW11]MDT8999825.1 DUF1631 family protein [Paucibacter sp. APW11]